nr:AAA family ATPase [bacterium]
MINKLLVQNFAVIESTEIGFSEGLNLFTGETGAGKTLIADSIEFVLGGRASKTMIRRGTDECSV